MNIVDSSGWIEYFENGANADFFKDVLLDTADLLVPSICIYEVCKRLLVTYGEEAALQAVGMMGYGQEIPLGRDIATSAAAISVQHKLAMADSVILASAYDNQATLWTQDRHFKDIAGVQYIEKA